MSGTPLQAEKERWSLHRMEMAELQIRKEIYELELILAMVGGAVTAGAQGWPLADRVLMGSVD